MKLASMSMREGWWTGKDESKLRNRTEQTVRLEEDHNQSDRTRALSVSTATNMDITHQTVQRRRDATTVQYNRIMRKSRSVDRLEG